MGLTLSPGEYLPRNRADGQSAVHSLACLRLCDSLPGIDEAATGGPYPDPLRETAFVDGTGMISVLPEVCDVDGQQFLMARELFSAGRRFRTMTRRAGLFGELEKVVRKYAVEDEEDALNFALPGEERIVEARGLPQPGTGAPNQPELHSGTDTDARPAADQLAADLRTVGLVPVDRRTDKP
ncbi:hypothetical protein [Streptomyces sp. NPDC002402]